MDNIKCTIGYERRVGTYLQLEVLDHSKTPQDIVAGLQSGKYVCRAGYVIKSPSQDGKIPVANILSSREGAEGEPEGFFLDWVAR